VRVLSAVPKIPPSAAELWFDAAGSLEAVWESRRERARELTARAAEILCTSGLTTETAVVDGSLSKAVQTQAANWAADLVIIGSLPRRLLQSWQAARIGRHLAGQTACSVEVFRNRRAPRSTIAT
jgi:nucleotide-binding universal stress UspA family protein